MRSLNLVCLLLGLALLWGCTIVSSSPDPRLDAGNTETSHGDAAALLDAASRAPDSAADGGHGGDAGGAGADAAVVPDPRGVECTQNSTVTFPSFDRSCDTDADCVAQRRPLNCCGAEALVAVNRSAVPAFKAAVAACESQLPACGCFSDLLRADDGTERDDSHPFARTRCAEHVCGTSFFGCGDPGDPSAPGYDFQSRDETFAGAYATAKATCDQRLGWACGTFNITLDGGGCVVDVAQGEAHSAAYAACLLQELTGMCSRCEASERRRFEESCTIM